MCHKTKPKQREHTAPDHRPMLPELRRPCDPVDAAIREARRNDVLFEVKNYLNWR